jgi:hypothetical protein
MCTIRPAIRASVDMLKYSIITSFFEVLGNIRIELNHPAFMQRPFTLV